jgi:chromosome partitioning protein
MDQQGSLSSSFLPNTNDPPVVITDVLLNKQISLKDAIVRTAFENIDIVPANLGLSKIESELLSDRDSHYYLADRLKEVESDYDFILVDAPPNPGLATWLIFTASDGVIIPLETQDYSVKEPAMYTG